MSEEFRFDTRAVRAGTQRSAFNEHSEALFLTSSFVFKSASEAAGMFAGSEDGFVYSRFSNPTVRMFEQRLAALEGAQDCLATASGMAAILSTALAAVKTGDHIVCSASVFGATVQLFSTILGRFGVETTFVRGADPAAWRAAITPRTRLLFCETPSNPLMEIVDLAAFAALGRESGALTVVDNCFCTPVMQRPFDFGVDVVIHSGTKYLDGQGRVVGGAVLGSRDFIRNACCRSCAVPVRACRHSTPGSCSRGWRRWACGCGRNRLRHLNWRTGSSRSPASRASSSPACNRIRRPRSLLFSSAAPARCSPSNSPATLPRRSANAPGA
jgi:cystathionine beta-lyase/cystathionine gamma-synthase